jgi:hypothetical protein
MWGKYESSEYWIVFCDMLLCNVFHYDLVSKSIVLKQLYI